MYLHDTNTNAYTHTVAEAVEEVNSCLGGDDPAALLQALHNQYGGLQNVQDSNALHYVNILKAMKAAKVEVGMAHLHCVQCTCMYMYYVELVLPYLWRMSQVGSCTF